ncbi:MAG: hypothetical protein K6G56_00195 [Clostridiales bacterium]|nr:hypothetical protein [Clostridiales bacterium]
MNRHSVIKRCFVFLFVLAFVSICACSKPTISAQATPVPEKQSDPTEAPAGTAEAASEPTDTPAPSEKATEAPVVTEAPSEEPTGEEDNWKLEGSEASCRDYLEAAARAVLSGTAYAADVKLCSPCLYLRRTEGPSGDSWTAYGEYEFYSRKSAEAPYLYEFRYKVNDPVKSFPAELEKDSLDRIAQYTKEYLHMDVAETEDRELPSDRYMPAEAFTGEDWMLISSQDPAMNRYVHAIWRTDDGENYHEFGHNNEWPGYVTGACIVSGSTGFICQEDPYTSDLAVGFKVFGTFDGGETWQELGLELPEKYRGFTYAEAFFPYFEGERGIVFVSVHLDEWGEYGRNLTRCFITEDGGHTWAFKD